MGEFSEKKNDTPRRQQMNIFTVGEKSQPKIFKSPKSSFKNER